jgi:hypothetical protein
VGEVLTDVCCFIEEIYQVECFRTAFVMVGGLDVEIFEVSTSTPLEIES